MGWEIFFSVVRCLHMQVSNLSYVSVFEPDGDKISGIVQNGRNGTVITDFEKAVNMRYTMYSDL